jgi:hypothetical protein
VRAQELERLARVVVAHVRMVEEYCNRFYPETRPEPESRADLEHKDQELLTDEWSAAPISLAYGMAAAHLASADDHLFGLPRLLYPPPAPHAVMTVTRSVVETCARAVWLLDPAIDARTRVARVMTERLYGLHQQLMTHARLTGEAGDFTEEMEAIRRSAVNHSMPWIADRRHRPPAVGAHRPSATEAIRTMMQHVGQNTGVAAYADLSAVAHNTVASFLRPVALLELLDQPPRHPMPIPYSHGTVLALSSYGRAWELFMRMHGWNTRMWNDFLREAHAELRSILGIGGGPNDVVQAPD